MFAHGRRKNRGGSSLSPRAISLISDEKKVEEDMVTASTMDERTVASTNSHETFETLDVESALAARCTTVILDHTLLEDEDDDDDEDEQGMQEAPSSHRMSSITQLTQRRPIIVQHRPLSPLPHREATHIKWADELTIYHHAVTVDHNPGSNVIKSVPWGLDWTCLETERKIMEIHEQERKENRRSPRQMVIDAETRLTRLRDEWQVEEEDIKAATGIADAIRYERARSYHSRPQQEIQGYADRLRYAKEIRRQQLVVLRTQFYKAKKEERKAAKKAEQVQKKQERRKVVRGLFGF